MTTRELADIDKRVLWHPFTQQQGWTEEDPLIVERAQGCTLYDTDGNAYIDGISSLWCTVHGHRHPAIDAAVRAQLDRVAHTTMLGLSHPPAVQLAEKHGAYIGGDDFKSGQTKMKSALVDFLINAGIKLTSIASYNHLGNNDGKNLSSQKQFRSKEISKSNVVDDMVAANTVLYEKDEHPDHVVVIKYIPAVGDSKRALDEYHAEIFLGGHQTIS